MGDAGRTKHRELVERATNTINYKAVESYAAEQIVNILAQYPELVEKCELHESDFYDPLIKATYGYVRTTVAGGNLPSITDCARHVECDFDSLRGLFESSCEPSKLASYAFTVANGALTRRIREKISRSSGVLANPGTDAEDALEDLIKELADCRKNGESGLSTNSLLDAEIAKIIDLKERKDRGENVRLGVSTGLTDLDSYIGGLTRGIVTAGGAVTKMGKSSFSLQCALGAAASGEDVIYFPLEDKVNNTLHRFIARETGITAQDIRSLRFDTKQLDAMRRAKRVLEPTLARIHFDDTAGLTAEEIGRRIRRWAISHPGRGLAVVDYLQLIRPTKGQDENVSIINTMRELSAVAKDTGIAVLAMSQLNDRKVTDRGNQIFQATQEYYGFKPEFSDFKWSSAIEECSKLVLLFHRPAFFNKDITDDEFQIIVALSNFGESGKTLPYIWNGRLTKIENKLKNKREK